MMPERQRVDHTYRDFSLYLHEGGRVVKHKKYGANFPARLHKLLAIPEYSHAIVWMVSQGCIEDEQE